MGDSAVIDVVVARSRGQTASQYHLEMAQLFEDRPVAVIEAYFEKHGLALRIHTIAPKPPSSGELRELPRSVRRAIETDTSTHWADLGPMRRYGKGRSPDEAIRNAARRYRIEQAPEDLEHG